ncbi:Crp/Fnr family transcriptional regulator [Aliiroseovarius sp. KMU-50]|uniref:Crp/Fnr family transcriptional regulator n=1 Tax=Aliiroseovarius salicola TaxID=3009082 RepID=A0ABT4W2U2_9RHOB|nr:Crp/Fnr family transcriptional regulator [Aliiroseovarius sp. KMU-50]MDA5094822.1 Crp/Fnr family transcriptional regulator [Aliiroseovarius sp. KMU-50]
MNSKSGNFQVESEAGQTDALADALHALSTVSVVSRGQDLFQQGDEGDSIYLLKSGSLEISSLSDDGRKLTLNVLKSGDIFGEIALFDGGRRSATVTALEDSNLLQVGRQRLLAEFSDNPDLALELLGLLIRRVRWISMQLENHAFHPLEVRLARRLLFLAGQVSDRNGRISVSQSALADHVGATREAVSKKLAEWKNLGIVEVGRGNLTILDHKALSDIASFDQL